MDENNEIVEYRVREIINGLNEKTYEVIKITKTPKLFGGYREDRDKYCSFDNLHSAVEVKHRLEEEMIKRQKKNQIINKRWITQNEEIAGSI